MISSFYLRSLLLLLLPVAALAQELPPPGGWPLRPMAELRAVPEPPGGLVPYRQGALWGFADTTGRVWIRPVFATEPARFGAGLLLQAEQQAPKEYIPRRVFRRVGAGSYGRQKKSKANRQRETNEPRSKAFVLSSNMRYGHWVSAADGVLSWALLTDKPYKNGRTWLLNARGEQVIIRADEAIEQAPDGSWRAAARRGPGLARPELVAIASHELEAGALRPGQLFTVPLARRAPIPPPRLTRRRAYAPDADFTASFAGSTPLYLAQKVNWLRPTRQVLRNGRCGDRFEDTDTRYRHKGQFALFDARGHRHTDYRYSGMKRLLPQRLAYWHWSDSIYHDENAAQLSGLPQRWKIIESINGPARRYGLLDRHGREITPPLYARLEAVGPNSLWVVAVRGGRLLYGLIDTLGRYHLPLRPEPISLPDAAGLLRRYSTAPLPAVKSTESFQLERRYPDTTTVQYLHSDGRPAFAGRYTRAGAFWEGRALVRQNGLVGILDTLGRWVLPPQPDELNYYAYSTAQRRQSEAVDPLELFDQFDGYQPMSGYYGTLPGDSLLLLTHTPQGYGLRDGRTGRVLVPAQFEGRPGQWPGGVVGQRRGKSVGVSYGGQPFDPEVPAHYPPGVKRYPADMHRPLLQHTEQGWRTRGGRQLWLD